MGNKTKVIPHSFFARDTLTVAEGLLGKTLVRKRAGEEVRLEIIEVEAYVSAEDLACHASPVRNQLLKKGKSGQVRGIDKKISNGASKGRTKRTEVMFGDAGVLYIYLIYGMYWMLNIVTQEEGHPAAVLIRGAGEYDGPGKLTRALEITGDMNGMMLGEEAGFWIEEGREVEKGEILRTPRIGVEYAGEWATKPYRFVLKEN